MQRDQTSNHESIHLHPPLLSYSKQLTQSSPSMTPTSISSFEEINVYMKKKNIILDYFSQSIFSSVSFEKSIMIATDSISKSCYAWHLPDSYELKNLREKSGIIYHPNLISSENTSSSMQMNQSFSSSSSSKQIHTTKTQQFISLKQTPHYILSKFLSSYSANNPSCPMISSFPAPSTYSTKHISLTKSKNFFSEQKLAIPTSLITSYERERSSQQPPIISRKRISSYLIDEETI